MPKFEPTLDLPGRWITDYCRSSAPNLYNPLDNFGLGFTLALSWDPKGRGAQHLAEVAIDFRDVARDLSGGFALSRDSRGAMQMSGRSYYVTAVGTQGKRSGRPMACVTDVGRITEPRQHSVQLSSNVTFVSLDEEKGCDLSLLDAAWSNAKRSRSLQEDARRQAEFTASQFLDSRDRDLGLQDLSDTHRVLRKQYGCLQQILDLLKTRTAHEGAAFARGTISRLDKTTDVSAGLDDCGVPLIVSPELQEGELQEGDLVELRGIDAAEIMVRTRIVSVSDKGIRLEMRDRLELSVGDAVEIKRIPRFPLRAHDRALEHVFRQDVAGSWKSLATLLSQPERLESPGVALTPRYFSDIDHERDPEAFKPLNTDQRRAVEGALSTPHAFFVQGPPGTGKTTVITEIVRQLTARGERVLLLAPTHVAVDEVLVRIARNRDHVFPVRLSYDDSRISREEIKKFSEDEIRVHLANRICSSRYSKAPEWERAQSRAQLIVNAIEAWLAAVATHNMAQDRAIRVASILRDSVSQSERELSQLGNRVHEQESALEVCQSSSATLTLELRRRQDELNQMQSSADWWEQALDIAGFGRISHAHRLVKLAQNELQGMNVALADLDSTLRESRKTLRLREKEWPRLIRLQVAKLEEREQEALAATELLGVAFAAAKSITGLENEAEIKATLHDELQTIRRTTQLFFLEKRWLELTRENDLAAEASDSTMHRLGNELLGLINLACGTTVGIASRELIDGVTFDTLIVDEASRVTDGEFLIGAVKARRWILVGDEHQLPPYVEQTDEHFLHALASLHLQDVSGGDLDSHVRQLGAMWREDEELHQFREQAVSTEAQRLLESGAWQKVYQPKFREAIKYFDNQACPQQELLNTVRLYFVRSLFERCVSLSEGVNQELKVRLKIQRRMIEPIAQLVSGPVYAGDYLSPRADELAAAGITPLVLPLFKRPVIFMDTSKRGPAAFELSLDSANTEGFVRSIGLDQRILGRSGFINRLEAEWICRVCTLLDEAAYGEDKDLTVSILCFYKAQSRLIKHMLLDVPMRRIRFSVIDAIDRIQGQESDVVLISFCRSQPRRGPASTAFGRWLKDYRRLNVASTRAHRSLIMVGNVATLEKLSFSEEEASAKAFYENLWSLVDPHNKGHSHPQMGTMHDLKFGVQTR